MGQRSERPGDTCLGHDVPVGRRRQAADQQRSICIDAAAHRWFGRRYGWELLLGHFGRHERDRRVGCRSGDRQLLDARCHVERWLDEVESVEQRRLRTFGRRWRRGGVGWLGDRRDVGVRSCRRYGRRGSRVGGRGRVIAGGARRRERQNGEQGGKGPSHGSIFTDPGPPHVVDRHIVFVRSVRTLTAHSSRRRVDQAVGRVSLRVRKVKMSACIVACCAASAAPPWPPSMFSQ